MAKEGRFWFDHDYQARNDDKILELRAEFGAEGYGVFWMIIETMADSEKAHIQLSLIGGLAHGYGVSKTKLSEIIKFCVLVGLLIELDGFISSIRVQNHKIYRKEISKKNSENIKKRWDDLRNKQDTKAIRPNTTVSPSYTNGIQPVYETDTHNMTITEHIDDTGLKSMTEDDFLDFSKKMKEDRTFTNPIFQQGVKPEHLDKWILRYHIHIVGEENTKKDYREYKKHFKNWLNLQEYWKPPPELNGLEKIRQFGSSIKSEQDTDFEKYTKK